jgi:isocitrate/isopropylmalate dehydrogenase
MTTGMVLKPQSPGSIVATNIHADILSNHAGALAGSLGVAPTMNIEPDIMGKSAPAVLNTPEASGT